MLHLRHKRTLSRSRFVRFIKVFKLIIWSTTLTRLKFLFFSFFKDIHGLQTMNPPDLDDLLTFPLTLPCGWHFCFLVNCLSNYWTCGCNSCCEIRYRYPWCSVLFGFVTPYFYLWPHSCKTSEIPISLSCTWSIVWCYLANVSILSCKTMKVKTLYLQNISILALSL